MFNNDIAYARSRLRGTYMLPKDETKPLKYILDVAKGNNGSLDALTNEERLPLSDFHYATGPLGYVDDGDRCHFISRMPLRRDWRQGLRSSQLVIMTGNTRKSGVSSSWMERAVSGLTDTLRGRFRNNIGSALEWIEETGKGALLSRRFLLTSSYKLYYKGLLVGSLNKRELLMLKTKFEFLREDLEKEVGTENVVR